MENDAPVFFACMGNGCVVLVEQKESQGRKTKKNKEGMYSLFKKERRQNVPNKSRAMAKTMFSISVAG